MTPAAPGRDTARSGQASPTDPRQAPRRGLTAIAVLAALVVLATIAAPAVAAANPQGRPDDGRTLFRSQCRYSHSAPDDPIVHPGMSGDSHLHDFFANTTTSADSTYRSLRAGSTTCDRPADTAAYWVPALYQNGQKVQPLFANAYYLRAGKRGPIVAPPAGLEVVAGDSKATAPQSMQITNWKCSGSEQRYPTPIVCPTGQNLVLVINFPDCWNGKDLDSADHQSHLAYSVGRVCPSSHPVPIPRLSLRVHYRLSDVSGLTFSSGSLVTAHADFFNAWNQAALDRLVRTRLN